MQIVIELSDETYDKVINPNNWYDPNSAITDIVKAIENGILLPKGHGKLIDADEIQFENAEFDTYGDYCIAFDAIDQADTIIEADKAESEDKE